VARICAACRQPVERDARDHDCPADDDPGGPVSLNPLPPVPYDGPVHDADGDGPEAA
jgi:hypothetical protein